MKVLISLFTPLLVALPLAAVAGGTDIGNGGDLVKCVPYNGNDLFGLYSLDYLVFASEKNAKAPVPVQSWQESIFSIRRTLIDKVPELLPVFDEFTNNILNQDHSRRQVWEPTEYELIEISDEQLPVAVKIPVNCRNEGKIELLQAVIRQKPDFSGSSVIIYKYMARVFEKMAQERPLQLSFLLVHEFLWSISDNVDRNRRINWFFHSQEFREMSRIDVIDRLRGMGLDVTMVPRILDASGRGHFTTLQDALAKARSGETIIVKEGTYSTGGASLVTPIRLVGEGDRAKIIIKGTKSYPALEVALSQNDYAEVENVTLDRQINFDNRDDYYHSDLLNLVTGGLRIKNSLLKSQAKHVLVLGGSQNLELEKVTVEGVIGLSLFPQYRGNIRVVDSTFNTESDGIRIRVTSRPASGEFSRNTFNTDRCGVWIDADEQNSEKYKERFLPMFTDNIYSSGNKSGSSSNWMCNP